MTILIGGHVDQVDAITGAKERQGELVQLMLGDPQSWKGPRIDYPGGASQLRHDAKEAGISIYVHSPYVINVASTNNRVRIPSRKLLQKNIFAAAEIGAVGVVVHGGHVSVNDDPEFGYENWFKCASRLDFPIPIFIENTAGGKNAMARHLDRLEKVWQAISRTDNANQIGFCLDTCHAHAAGLDFEGLVEKITAITGRIDLVHCNDSRDNFGSGADRHANLGQGKCDPAELVETVKQANCPVIVETPGGSVAQKADIAWLRSRLGIAGKH